MKLVSSQSESKQGKPGKRAPYGALLLLIWQIFYQVFAWHFAAWALFGTFITALSTGEPQSGTDVANFINYVILLFVFTLFLNIVLFLRKRGRLLTIALASHMLFWLIHLLLIDTTISKFWPHGMLCDCPPTSFFSISVIVTDILFILMLASLTMISLLELSKKEEKRRIAHRVFSIITFCTFGLFSVMFSIHVIYHVIIYGASIFILHALSVLYIIAWWLIIVEIVSPKGSEKDTSSDPSQASACEPTSPENGTEESQPNCEKQAPLP